MEGDRVIRDGCLSIFSTTCLDDQIFAARFESFQVSEPPVRVEPEQLLRAASLVRAKIFTCASKKFQSYSQKVTMYKLYNEKVSVVKSKNLLYNQKVSAVQ